MTPEDAEAIANVEKLTGMKIPVLSIDGESSPEDRPAEAKKPKGRERSEKQSKPRGKKSPRVKREAGTGRTA